MHTLNYITIITFLGNSGLQSWHSPGWQQNCDLKSIKTILIQYALYNAPADFNNSGHLKSGGYDTIIAWVLASWFHYAIIMIALTVKFNGETQFISDELISKARPWKTQRNEINLLTFPIENIMLRQSVTLVACSFRMRNYRSNHNAFKVFQTKLHCVF